MLQRDSPSQSQVISQLYTWNFVASSRTLSRCLSQKSQVWSYNITDVSAEESLYTHQGIPTMRKFPFTYDFEIDILKCLWKSESGLYHWNVDTVFTSIKHYWHFRKVTTRNLWIEFHVEIDCNNSIKRQWAYWNFVGNYHYVVWLFWSSYKTFW